MAMHTGISQMVGSRGRSRDVYFVLRSW